MLAHRKWREKHMASAIDLAYSAFLKIETNPLLMLWESFVMEIFKPLYRKLPELEDYLSYYFEDKETCSFGSKGVDDRLKGIKLVREEVFSPVDADNRASFDCCVWLAGDIAATLILEMNDPRKVTCEYLTATNGKFCMKNTTAAEKKSAYGVRANNDPSEGNFATFGDSLGMMGNANLD